jgi:virulence factor Mce-like protein
VSRRLRFGRARKKRGLETSKRQLAVIGAAVLAVIAVGTLIGFTKRNPFKDRYEIRAAFASVSDLKPRSPVRISGVNIGKVTKVEGLGKGRSGAIVTMELNDEGRPIHRDATFKVRPRIFLEGNYFVDVQPGSPSEPELKENALVPATQTAAPVGFFQFLEVLQSDTREDLRTVLREYGKAVDSEGGDAFNRAVKYWEPAFRDSAIVADATRGKLEHDLSNYLKGAERVASGLDRRPEELKDLITTFAQTADAFADEQANLSRAIHELPSTLATGRRALGVLNEAFPPVRRFVADFRPAVRSSGPALDATLPFVRQMRRLVRPSELRGLVRDLRPLVPSLVELNRGGVHLQEQQRALSSCSNDVISPWQRLTVPDPSFPSSGPVYQEGVKWLPGIAGESRSFDANGQYVRSLAKGGNYTYPVDQGRFFVTDSPVLGVNPPKAPGFPPYRPDVPCETQPVPDLRTRVQQAPRAVKVNHNAPGAAERRAKAREIAMKWMEGQLKYSGLDKELTLVDEPLKASEIDDVVRTLRGGR